MLNKSIKYRKEKRKPYRGAKDASSYCRNHGWCPWCRGNRLYQQRKMMEGRKIDEAIYEAEAM